MGREADRSPRWMMETIRCHKCGIDKPPQAFIVHRKTVDCIGNTCQDCQVTRTSNQKIRANVDKQRWRAKQIGAVNTLTSDQWIDKLRSSGGYCYYCRTYVGVELLTIDHIVALDNGGANAIENVIPACWNCNLHKSTS